MFQKSWVRILTFSLIAVLALGAVGFVAYRAGYRVGAQSAQSYGMPFGSGFWGSRQGGGPVAPSPYNWDSSPNQPDFPSRPRGFDGQTFGYSGRMPYHMGYMSFSHSRFPFFSWFGPGLLLGLIVLGGLTFLLVRKYNQPAVVEEKKPATRKTSK